MVRRDAEQAEVCRIYVKGAPEEVLPLCSQTLSLDVQPVELPEDAREAILQTVEERIARKGQKPLSYAVRLISSEELQSALPNVEEDSPEYRAVFERDLIYLGTFGLDDPLRANVASVVNML